jgi:hypothetical protein
MEEREDIKWLEWEYQVSNTWKIKWLDRCFMKNWKTKCLLKWKERKIIRDKDWYFCINLFYEWVEKHKRVHRLVAETFIPNPDNKPYINHKNWDKTDNRVENLEWCTPSENAIHARDILWIDLWKYRRWKKWINSATGKMVWQYCLDWTLLKVFGSVKEASLYTWVNDGNICSHIKWKYKTVGGYLRKYV